MVRHDDWQRTVFDFWGYQLSLFPQIDKQTEAYCHHIESPTSLAGFKTWSFQFDGQADIQR